MRSGTGRDILTLGTSILLVLLFSWLSSLPVITAMPWYASLSKPPFTPPSWLFGIIWPVLYVLITLAAWLVWRQRLHYLRYKALNWFGFQLFANLLWTGLFFGQRALGLAMAWNVVVIALAIAATVYFFRISRPAGWLMTPYVLWLGFAVYLSTGIWLQN